MTVQIAIAITAPYVTAQQFADLAKIPVATVKNKIRNGELPIRKKHSHAGSASRETPLINMVALTLEGAASYKGNLTINIEGTE
ncbi:helix-turn-helix domain-containing protein [Gilliamella apicola]|uniref:Helix-turn-helix domain-containing protein n=1 Tax=Gilliamella apicola TaxID=1196095 RepID=A0A556RS97_9GAMM|nr:helix-turn-helix domain-containing protein [Gilliamella apicola]TSJ91777.1 helix-turn-helix domain-containing protein [Gilliamella apicola]